MQLLLVITSLLALAQSRPGISGYNYQKATANTFSEERTSGYSNNRGNGGETGNGYPRNEQSGNRYSGNGVSGYSSNQGNGRPSGNALSNGDSGYTYNKGNGRPSGNAFSEGASGYSNNLGNDGQFGNGYPESGASGYAEDQGGYGGGESVVVQKHIYVHVPPPSLEEPYSTRTPLVAPPSEKHYKIVFIKAPTAPAPTVSQLPPPAQKEEKTLVYVLVQKPEEAPEINIPTAAPTQPSKPEVYFIRYKAKADQEGYPPAGQPANAGTDIQHDGSLESGPYNGGDTVSSVAPVYGPPQSQH